MIDRKKVIKALEDAYVTDGVIKMSIQVRDVLVALLKEQEAVVRCKDCRKNMMCEMTIHKPKDWFCADGERRDDDA